MPAKSQRQQQERLRGDGRRPPAEALAIAAAEEEKGERLTPSPVIGDGVELDVLDALDPFWTRGILLRGSEQKR